MKLRFRSFVPFLSAVALAFSANATYRYWDSTNENDSIADGGNWSPAFDFGTDDISSDTFAITNGATAQLNASDSFSTKYLRIGWGRKYNSDGTHVSDNSANDFGGTLNTYGTLAATDLLTIGDQWSDNYSATMNVFGGAVTTALLRMGDCASGNSKSNTLNIAAGTFTVTGSSDTQMSAYSGGTSYINIYGTGKYSSSSSALSIGQSGTATVTVDGGSLSLGSYIWVAKNGRGTLNLLGGNVEALGIPVGDAANGTFAVTSGECVTTNIWLGYGTNGSGTMTVGGDGKVAIRQDLYIGRSGSGLLTINGGEVACSQWIVLRSDNKTNSGRLNLNGGVLSGWAIYTYDQEDSDPTTAVLNWNGGTFKPNGGQSDILPAKKNTVNVMAGGAIVDTGSSSLTSHSISHDLSGEGKIVKKGASTLTLNGSVDLKRGIEVQAGTLAIASGKLVATSATSPVREITVAEGATLNLNGQEIYTLNYSVDGTAKGSGDYAEQGGTIHVVTISDAAPATAVWTGAANDGNHANPDNWQVFNGEGTEIWGVAPNTATLITGFEAVAGSEFEIDDTFVLGADLDMSDVTLSLGASANVNLNGYTLKLGAVTAESTSTFAGPGTVSIGNNGADKEFIKTATLSGAVKVSITGAAMDIPNTFVPSGGIEFHDIIGEQSVSKDSLANGLTVSGGVNLRPPSTSENDWQDASFEMTISGEDNVFTSYSGNWGTKVNPFKNIRMRGDGSLFVNRAGTYGRGGFELFGKGVPNGGFSGIFAVSNARQAGFQDSNENSNPANGQTYIYNVDSANIANSMSNATIVLQNDWDVFVDGSTERWSRFVLHSENESAQPVYVFNALGTAGEHQEKILLSVFNQNISAGLVGVLRVGANGGDATFNGVITNSYFTGRTEYWQNWDVEKYGAGKWTLGGTVANGGAFTVFGGEVAVDGTMDNVSTLIVKSGTALSGTGTIAATAVTLEDGATVRSGLEFSSVPASEGTTTFSLAKDSSGNVLKTTLDSMSVDLSGWLLDFDASLGLSATSYVIAEAAEGGTFSVVPTLGATAMAAGWSLAASGNQLVLSRGGIGAYSANPVTLRSYGATEGNYSYDGALIADGAECKVYNSIHGLMAMADAWYDPSDAATLTLDGGKVTKVANKSVRGAEMDAEPYDATSLPTTSGNYLSFSNKYGYRSAGTVDSTKSQSRSLFVVSQRTTGSMYSLEIGAYDSSDNGDVQIFQGTINEYDSFLRAYALDENDVRNWVRPEIGKNDINTTFVYSLCAYGSTLDAWGNGASSSKTYNALTTTASDGESDDVAYIYYGMRRNGALASSGLLGEALAFTQPLSATERAVVQNYLAGKWLDSWETSPTMDTTTLSSLQFLNGATVDFDGAKVSLGTIVGAGAISNCTIVVTVKPDGTIDAPFTLADGASLAIGDGVKLYVQDAANLGDDYVTSLPSGVTGSFASVETDDGKTAEYVRGEAGYSVRKYTGEARWTGAVSSDYSVSGNWLPGRDWGDATSVAFRQADNVSKVIDFGSESLAKDVPFWIKWNSSAWTQAGYDSLTNSTANAMKFQSTGSLSTGAMNVGASNLWSYLAYDSGTYTNSSLKISDESSGRSRVDVSSGASVHVSGDIQTYGTAGGSGADVVLGGALSSDGTFYLGNSTSSVSTLTVVYGGTLTSNFHPGYANGSTGIVHQTGGTVNSKNYMGIAHETGSVGKYHITGGTLNFPDSNRVLVVGRSGDGEMIVGKQSESVYGTVNCGVINIAENAGATGTLVIDGGTVNAGGQVNVGRGTGCNATLTIDNGFLDITGDKLELCTGEGRGTLNLNGGVLSANWIQKWYQSSNAVATINWNGGTFKAKANRTTDDGLIRSGTVVNIMAGGAVLDTYGHDVSIFIPMSGVGGVTKVGAGKLTLSKAIATSDDDNSTFAGALAVSNGVLAVSSLTVDANRDVFVSLNDTSSAPVQFTTLTKGSGKLSFKCVVDAATSEGGTYFVASGLSSYATEANFREVLVLADKTEDDAYFLSWIYDGGTLKVVPTAAESLMSTLETEVLISVPNAWVVQYVIGSDATYQSATYSGAAAKMSDSSATAANGYTYGWCYALGLNEVANAANGPNLKVDVVGDHFVASYDGQTVDGVTTTVEKSATPDFVSATAVEGGVIDPSAVSGVMYYRLKFSKQ